MNREYMERYKFFNTSNLFLEKFNHKGNKTFKNISQNLLGIKKSIY